MVAVVGGNWFLFLGLILHSTIIILHQLFNKYCFEDTKENSKGRDSPSKTSQSMGDRQTEIDDYNPTWRSISGDRPRYDRDSDQG